MLRHEARLQGRPSAGREAINYGGVYHTCNSSPFETP
eukprot:CAMPEP_0117586244 /NCGR_PEP_ID=MMETSP0784-20121206/68612_1 /TAXON_ID=39447 /ORGANISM="" /LENGTH=36 /DNA_ID= /DNA_START= /DNA_END= /DNA_ORIENTATION=